MFPEIAAGAAAGLAGGLVPGMHQNNLALLVAPLGPLAIIAAAVASSFSSILPSVYLGAPADGKEAGVLPAHRMLAAGKGARAVRISVLSLLLSVPFFLALLPAVSMLVPARLPREATLAVLLFFSAVLLLSERDFLAGAAFFIASGLMGKALVSAGTLFPLFAGFFSAPLLVEALGRGGAMPPSSRPAGEVRIGSLLFPVFLGSLSGFFVGTFPALTVSVVVLCAAVLAGGTDTEEFLALSVSAGFSSLLFSLPAAAKGAYRNGVVAIAGIGPADLGSAVVVALAVAGISAFATSFILPARLRIPRMNEISLALLAGSVALFSGLPGLAVFLAAAVLGLLAGRAGAGRRVLMGSLIVPTLLAYLR